MAVADPAAPASASLAGVLTSQLSRLECRSKPLRDGDAEILAQYDALFGLDE
jgi:hypothetical protein